MSHQNARWFVRTMDHLSNLSYGSIFFMWGSGVLGFAALYTALSYAPIHALDTLGISFAERIMNALYFSVVTATTVGYGDILPHGLSRFFAGLEAILGFLFLAIFVTKLSSRKQELALREIHKLVFENTFHNMRESLHVIRRDLEFVVIHVKKQKELHEEDFRRLEVAYEQISAYVNEIPHFYDTANSLYVIDERREDLLIEAVQRTLRRVNDTLATLTTHAIPWAHHEESVARLRELTHAVAICGAVWKTKTPYGRGEAFETILHFGESINTRIDKEMPL